MANDYQVLHFFFYYKKNPAPLHACRLRNTSCAPMPCKKIPSLLVYFQPTYLVITHARLHQRHFLCASAHLKLFTYNLVPGSWQGCPHRPQQKLFKGPSGASVLLLSLLLLRTAVLPSSGGPAQVTGMSWDLLRVPNIWGRLPAILISCGRVHLPAVDN